jgi:hypothetical protein
MAVGMISFAPTVGAATIGPSATGAAARALAGSHTTSVVEDVLLAVACPSSTDCVAVGYSGTPNTQNALIEHWNGTSWHAIAPPVTKGTFSSSLDGISCPTPSSCTAVGDALNAKTEIIEPLVVKGSGSSWRDIASPGLDAGEGALLESVSCSSVTVCLATGENLVGSGSARAEQWNGKKWVVLTPPLSPANATTVELESVWCGTAASCQVVGSYQLGGDELTLAESWNGAKWTIEQTPGGPTATLRSVSCVSGSACMAVGESTSATGVQVALAVSWNGKTWTDSGATAPAGRVSPQLSGVSCTLPKSCIAVGTTAEDTIVNPTDAPLAETWNGSAWRLIDPSPLAKGSQLLIGVAADSSTALAVGNNENVISGAEQTLAELWSGTRWTTLATSNP